jgi:carbamoyltransferase
MAHVLGISCFTHDAAAALVTDGVVVAAAQEERFTRRKHEPAFPEQAINYVLDKAGISAKEVDLAMFHEKPLRHLDRIVETHLAMAPRSLKPFVVGMPSWLTNKLFGASRLEALGCQDLGWALHHESHAASAFFCSPFEEAAILTCDGVGEWHTNTLGIGVGNRVRLQSAQRFPHSLGLLYSSITQFLGFRVNSGEYKVMGLAAYGEPVFADRIRDGLIEVADDGSYRLNVDAFGFLSDLVMTTDAFESLFGVKARTSSEPMEAIYQDIAASMQRVLEDLLLAQVRHVTATTKHRKLCLAGGVALNSVAIGRLRREADLDDLWVQPASGDAGGALGAALLGWHHVLDGQRVQRPFDPFLGPRFDEIGPPTLAHTRPPDIAAAAAQHLAAGRTVGWFQGAMEFGPRALGARSILADPRNPEMQDRLNAQVKFREEFRPFAPAVLSAEASASFEVERDHPHMTEVHRVRVDGLPAVTHVDGTARLQTVSEDGPMHPVLAAFHQQTGCPILVNTSFNVRGEPIVCTPEDALHTFLSSGLDVLALGPWLIDKADVTASPVERDADEAPSWLQRLGQLQIRVLLTALYFLVVTPAGLIRRLFADPLGRQEAPTWHAIDPPDRYRQMY